MNTDNTSPLEHANVLRRRVRWLTQRIDQAKHKGVVLSYDVTERDALLWAIGELEQWVDIEPSED